MEKWSQNRGDNDTEMRQFLWPTLKGKDDLQLYFLISLFPYLLCKDSSSSAQRLTEEVKNSVFWNIHIWIWSWRLEKYYDNRNDINAQCLQVNDDRI